MARNETRVKLCRVCGRQFTWRRKWAACWDQVRYCSDRCRIRKNIGVDNAGTGANAE